LGGKTRGTMQKKHRKPPNREWGRKGARIIPMVAVRVEKGAVRRRGIT